MGGGSQTILFDGFGWKEGFRVMAMVRDLSGTYFSRISKGLLRGMVKEGLGWLGITGIVHEDDMERFGIFRETWNKS
jgi:hypothetical protein